MPGTPPQVWVTPRVGAWVTPPKAWVNFRILAVCVCLALVGWGSATSADPTPDLKALALRAGDLPGGFALDSGRYWSNSQAAARDRVPVSSYQTHGRIRSYQNIYSHPFAVNSPATGGLQRAGSEITEYRDARGAHWDWLRLRGVWRHATSMGSTTLGSVAGNAGRPVPFKPIVVPLVGNEDAGFAVTWGGDEFDYTTRVIVFRRGRYVATLEVIGIMQQVSLHKTMIMARTIDRRIAAAGA
jgi:hypothetical protein